MSYNAYAMTQQATEAPRDLEIRAIAFVTRQLTAANQPDAELITRIRALNANMQMWTLLVDDLSQPDNALPEVLKARLSSSSSVHGATERRPQVIQRTGMETVTPCTAACPFDWSPRSATATISLWL